jgi:hypothetical protein
MERHPPQVKASLAHRRAFAVEIPHLRLGIAATGRGVDDEDAVKAIYRAMQGARADRE